MKVAIVNKSDLKIALIYEAEAPTQSMYGGQWGDPAECIHLAIPADLDHEAVKAEQSEEGIAIVACADKAAEKLEREWAALRSKRNAKLSACDWTQMPDAPLSSDDKAAWALYRQELRDLPEDLTCPSEAIWPEEP